MHATTYYNSIKFTDLYFNKLLLQRRFPSRVFNLGGAVFVAESETQFTKLKKGDFVVKLEEEGFPRVLSRKKFNKLIEKIVRLKCTNNS